MFHVERATPKQLAERVVRVVMQGPQAGTDESPLDAEPRWLSEPGVSFLDALEKLPLGEALFFGEGLIATRALRKRALAAEPALTAFTLDADDPLREACCAQEPEYALQGYVGRPLTGPEDLRVVYADRAPEACVSALRGLSDALSDVLREKYLDKHPNAVLESLAWRDDDRSWQLRTRAWEQDQADDESRAFSLMGCSISRSQELREQLFEKNPLVALSSLRGTHTQFGDKWLAHMSEYAPKLVLGALAGRSDPFAYELRDSLFETGREVIDTVRRLDDERAFELRERALERWPSTVAHSLLGLPDSPRVHSMRERCETVGVGKRDLHMQRRLLLLSEQPLAPSWTKTSGNNSVEIEPDLA